MANLPIGREKGSFPHSNGANFSEVGFFFPSVEPKATIAAAIPAARIKLMAIPMYSFMRGQPRRQYTLSPESRGARHKSGKFPDMLAAAGNLSVVRIAGEEMVL